jgi:hypothetical protein
MSGAEVETGSVRDRILDAIVELCMVQSYEETTIEQVMTWAGVSHEDFQGLFGEDKEECLLAAMNAIIGELVSAVSGSYSADRSEWDSYLLGIKAILELMAAKPAYAYLSYVVARQGAPARVRDAQKATAHIVAAMLERLWSYSIGEAQPVRMARASLGAAEAVIRRELVGGRAEELPQLLPDVVYGATVAFLGQEEALRLARRAGELLASAD